LDIAAQSNKRPRQVSYSRNQKQFVDGFGKVSIAEADFLYQHSFVGRPDLFYNTPDKTLQRAGLSCGHLANLKLAAWNVLQAGAVDIFYISY
jgi:hypothetical protein